MEEVKVVKERKMKKVESAGSLTVKMAIELSVSREKLSAIVKDAVLEVFNNL